MKTKTLLLTLAAATALTAGAASAQRHDGGGYSHSQGAWMSINQRQQQLDQRIDVGMRNGDLTRAEAGRLRADFNDLVNLEARYRANGLSDRDRADLDNRFNQLSQRIRVERADTDRRDWYGGNGWTDNRGRWVGMDQRKVQLDRRIDQGRRSGQLTNAEATRLRAEFNGIARTEYRYRSNGLSTWERGDLNRRFDQLAAQIRFERRDGDHYGSNDYRPR